MLVEFCPICRDQIHIVEKNDKKKLLPEDHAIYSRCRHAIHIDCAKEVLKDNFFATCPICRNAKWLRYTDVFTLKEIVRSIFDEIYKTSNSHPAESIAGALFFTFNSLDYLGLENWSFPLKYFFWGSFIGYFTSMASFLANSYDRPMDEEFMRRMRSVSLDGVVVGGTSTLLLGISGNRERALGSLALLAANEAYGRIRGQDLRPGRLRWFLESTVLFNNRMPELYRVILSVLIIAETHF